MVKVSVGSPTTSIKTNPFDYYESSSGCPVVDGWSQAVFPPPSTSSSILCHHLKINKVQTELGESGSVISFQIA